MSDTPAPAAIGTVAAQVDRTIDPRTGEPHRPWTVTGASLLFMAAVASMTSGLVWAFWRSVQEFPDAAWLNGVVETEPGSVVRVLMVTALFVATLLVGAASIIAGHYAWRGFGWARWAGVIAVAVSALAFLVNPVAWAAVPLAGVGAALLWTPRARGYFDRWQARRHPVLPAATATEDVHYGPWRRYQ